MMKKDLFSNVLSLVWNLLLVYVCYTLSRLVFLCVNWDTFSEHLTFGYAMSLFGAGIIFDTTATLGAKKAGVITGFLVIAAGICFCATSSRFKFLFPMANSLLGVHYTRYYREMVFLLSLSAYYFIGLLAVILFVAFIRCKKMNYNFDHEID